MHMLEYPGKSPRLEYHIREGLVYKREHETATTLRDRTDGDYPISVISTDSGLTVIAILQ